MAKVFRVLLWLFALMLTTWVYAEDTPSAVTMETPAEAQEAVTLATKALDQATAEEAQARKNLDKARQALAKKPKSAKAKKAVAAAQKELDSATALKAQKATSLKEEQAEQTAIAAMALESQSKNKDEETKKIEVVHKVTIYPTDKYDAFAEEFELVERVDPYFFFNDPVDFNNRTVILDARLDRVISPGVAKFTVWRNFGKMHLVVSNIPVEYAIPADQTFLLAGLITGFKNEVVSGQFELNVLINLKGAFICSNVQCHSGRL